MKSLIKSIFQRVSCQRAGIISVPIWRTSRHRCSIRAHISRLSWRSLPLFSVRNWQSRSLMTPLHISRFQRISGTSIRCTGHLRWSGHTALRNSWEHLQRSTRNVRETTQAEATSWIQPLPRLILQRNRALRVWPPKPVQVSGEQPSPWHVHTLAWTARFIWLRFLTNRSHSAGKLCEPTEQRLPLLHPTQLM